MLNMHEITGNSHMKFIRKFIVLVTLTMMTFLLMIGYYEHAAGEHRRMYNADSRQLAEDTFTESLHNSNGNRSWAALKRQQMYIQHIESVSKFSEVIKLRKRKRLPDLIGIGVEKCGSGALRHMLSMHPLIKQSNPAETHFFDNTTTYRKGLQYYINMMPEAYDYEIVMEKTPGYFNFHTMDLPERMREAVPQAKIVVVLCDPVNRTFSDFVQEIRMHHIPKESIYDSTMYELMSLVSGGMSTHKGNDTALTEYIFDLLHGRRQSHVLTTGLYFYHMKRWLRFYNNTNLHVINGEQLITNPGLVMEKLQDFLEIPRLIIKEDFVKSSDNGFYCLAPPEVKEDENGKMIVNSWPRCMSSSSKGRTRLGAWSYRPQSDVINMMRRFYAPHNAKLYKLLKRNFKWT